MITEEPIKIQEPKKKFLIPLIIIIGVLIIGGGIFAYFQFFKEGVKTEGEEQKNETADWKTYKNEQYGFEFKYPSDWMVTEKDADKTDTIKDGHLFEVSKYGTVGAAEISGVFEVNVFNFDDNQANFEKKITSIKRLYPNNREVSQDGLNGYKGENYVLDEAAETMTSLEVFLGNKGVYQVLIHYLEFKDGDYKKQTELIRSTLKFFQ